MTDNLSIIIIEAILAGGILIYLFFRRKSPNAKDQTGLRRIEIKLTGGMIQPSEIVVKAGEPFQLIIYRYDREPREELFEIEALDIYELLPALNATVIKLAAPDRGTYPMVLAGEKPAGTLRVE